MSEAKQVSAGPLSGVRELIEKWREKAANLRENVALCDRDEESKYQELAIQRETMAEELEAALASLPSSPPPQVDVPSDSVRPQSTNLRSGDEVWVRGKFLRYRDDGKLAVQLYPNSQDFFTTEQVKQALLIAGHSTEHAVVLKNELNGVLASSPVQPQEERAWLLERDNGHGPEWLGIELTGAYAEWIWSADSLKALRFSRRADANALAGIVEEADKITEHIWS